LTAKAPPRFNVGDKVRAINRHPLGHTREPRFVRGRVGVIHAYHGAHLLPDLSAQGVRLGSHLYSVRFAASELWGENANVNSSVYVDLWEDYLEPA
jgi:nitrile hydratase